MFGIGFYPTHAHIVQYIVEPIFFSKETDLQIQQARLASPKRLQLLYGVHLCVYWPYGPMIPNPPVTETEFSIMRNALLAMRLISASISGL